MASSGVASRRIVAELEDNGGCLVMWENGCVEHTTPTALLAQVRREDARWQNAHRVTQIEWRNVPDGWEPPR